MKKVYMQLPFIIAVKEEYCVRGQLDSMLQNLNRTCISHGLQFAGEVIQFKLTKSCYISGKGNVPYMPLYFVCKEIKLETSLSLDELYPLITDAFQAGICHQELQVSKLAGEKQRVSELCQDAIASLQPLISAMGLFISSAAQRGLPQDGVFNYVYFACHNKADIIGIEAGADPLQNVLRGVAGCQKLKKMMKEKKNTGYFDA